jgi:hypothetical protein
MKKKIKRSLVDLKSSLDQQISPNKQKILGTLATVPLIAAGTMSGACAGGCPYGLVNDPYPGQCSRYIDINGDGICDLSQSVAATSTSTTSNTNSQPNSHSSSQNTAPDTSSGVQDVQNGSSDPSNASAIQDPGIGGLDSGAPPADASNYHVLPITLLLIGGYFFTYYLFRKGILKPQKHKGIWNLLLVGGYLGTGVTGVLLTLMINLGISTIYNPTITYWHAELAILMVVGTLIHIHIYRKPFKNMFKVLFGFKSRSKKNNDRKSINMSK